MRRRGKSPNPSTWPVTMYVTQGEFEAIRHQAKLAKERSISRYAKRLALQSLMSDVLMGTADEQPQPSDLARSA